MLKQMAATENCSKVTAIFLIQPVSYLLRRQAAYPANYSNGEEDLWEDYLPLTALADAFKRKDQRLSFSSICT